MMITSRSHDQNEKYEEAKTPYHTRRKISYILRHDFFATYMHRRMDTSESVKVNGMLLCVHTKFF